MTKLIVRRQTISGVLQDQGTYSIAVAEAGHAPLKKIAALGGTH